MMMICLMIVLREAILACDDKKQGPQPRIVGGTNANPTKYPYAQVSLQDWSGEHQCGGTLVAPDVILSAAHCIPGARKAVIGVYDLRDTSEMVGDFVIAETIRHPKYNNVTFFFDVVLFRIDGNATSVDPVEINQDPTVPFFSETLIAVGWGATNITTLEYPDIMQETEIEYIGSTRCKQMEDEDVGYTWGFQISDDMLCAFGADTGIGFGDSGGPLLVIGDEPSQALQVGVTSYIAPVFNLPSVYHRTSTSFEWIRTNICNLSTAPPDYLSCNAESPTTSPVPSEANPTTSPSDSSPDSSMTSVLTSMTGFAVLILVLM